MKHQAGKAQYLEAFFAVSPRMVFPGVSADFDLWLRRDDDYVLYARGREGFTRQHLREMRADGVAEVYIHQGQREVYQHYVQHNLGDVLSRDNAPMELRAQVLYDASVDIIRDVFENRLPQQPDDRHFERILSLVSSCTDFLAKQDSLKSLASMISHHYQTYSHSLNVMIFALAVLDHYDLDRDRMIEIGLGALLHDVGKTGIPPEVLGKPGRLDPEQWKQLKLHPTRGVAMCSRIPLSQLTIHCIMFHHERMDGQGYPAGLTGDKIPFEVRAVSLADVYDALTADRPYANRVTPFQALRIMQDEMAGAFDEQLYKRLVLVLSGAGITTEG